MNYNYETTDNIISIFPNPFNQKFSVTTQKIFDKILIYNSLGEKIFENKNPDSSIEIDIKSNNSGIFLLELHQEDLIFRKRLLNINFMRHKIIIIILCFISNLIYSQNWNLIWNDEFDGLDLDNSKWTHDIGTGSQFGLWGWGNGELQFYQSQNTVVENGVAKISVKEGA